MHTAVALTELQGMEDCWIQRILLPPCNAFLGQRNSRVGAFHLLLLAVTQVANTGYVGHWKSEEFGKFALVAPFVLHKQIPRPAYNCFLLLHRIYKLVFSQFMRVEGWRAEDCELLEKLLWLHAISFEHLYSTSACTQNLEYSLHLPDDIRRHSSPDNYWCFMYERMVRFYKSQTNNQKTTCVKLLLTVLLN